METEALRLLAGDCREILPTLEPESVQCCVTSPPYWGLRDYGTAQWEGGESECDHVQIDRDYLTNGLGPNGNLPENNAAFKNKRTLYRNICGKCGACRIDNQLGLESTPEEYITKMVAVFREVWRVLRDDGTLWCNMGDSYASPIGGNNIGLRTAQFGSGNERGKKVDELDATRKASSVRKNIPGLKPKDLCGIPWRLAFALQADGWYLRSDIIWHKPNPMPESVTDRPTKSHEYIFLLTKAERYFYDGEAIREKSESLGSVHVAKNDQKMDSMSGIVPKGNIISLEYRNKRTVWTIPTQPYSDAHFATFPEEIPKLCILAGSNPGETILDPFAGSGTVGKVAIELGRKAILIELNPAYVELAKDRTFVTPGFF